MGEEIEEGERLRGRGCGDRQSYATRSGCENATNFHTRSFFTGGERGIDQHVGFASNVVTARMHAGPFTTEIVNGPAFCPDPSGGEVRKFDQSVAGSNGTTTSGSIRMTV